MELSKTQIIDSSNFLIQYLKDSGFTGDTENGTAIHDLLIKPMAVLYTLFKLDVDKSYGYLSIQKANELKGILGDEYDTAVDCILSNWFVTRNTGSITSGIIRAYFTKPLTSIYIDSSVAFVANTVTLKPTTATLYVLPDFITFYNTIRNVTEYYIDIPVESSTSTAKTIATTDLVTGSISNLFYSRAEVAVAFSVGNDIETSETFIARTQDVITTRELVSTKAINTVLMDNFQNIKRIYVAGFGASEQIRDLYAVGSVYVHIGNKVDVYVQTPLVKKVLIATTKTSVIDYVKILSVVNTVTKLPVSYATTGTSITVASTSNYTVTYLHATDVTSIRTFMEDCVVCCDTQVFPMTPVVLTIAITVKLSNTTIVPATIKASIATYVNGLEHSSLFSVLNMVTTLKTDVPGVNDVMFPVGITSFTESNIIKLYTDESFITVTNA